MQARSFNLQTPVGPMVALWGEPGLLALTWADRQEAARPHLTRHLGEIPTRMVERMPELEDPLRAYLAGEIDALRAIPVAPAGTAFQQTVWEALREIPAGDTWSYGQLAQHIGRPKAFRAVAQANGANPIPLVIPCHRVIAAQGRLGGFSSGLDRKRWLLHHERAWPDNQRQTYLWNSSAGSENSRDVTCKPT